MTVKAENSTPKKGRHPTKPFKKNDPLTGEKDPRINRRGRLVSDRAALKKELAEFLAEFIYTADPKTGKLKPMLDEVTGEKMTRRRASMRIASGSRNPAHIFELWNQTYGKPKEEIDVTSNGKQIVSVIEIIKTYKDEPLPPEKK
jgi:hypothetical protein